MGHRGCTYPRSGSAEIIHRDWKSDPSRVSCQSIGGLKIILQNVRISSQKNSTLLFKCHLVVNTIMPSVLSRNILEN